MDDKELDKIRKELDHLKEEELKIIVKRKHLENQLNCGLNKKFLELVGTCYCDEQENAYYKIIEYSENDGKFKVKVFYTEDKFMYMAVSIENIYYEQIERLKPISEDKYKSSLEKFKSDLTDTINKW